MKQTRTWVFVADGATARIIKQLISELEKHQAVGQAQNA